MKKRFIITYLLAFALLYGGGFWATGRMLGAYWSRLPTDPQRKVNPGFESVHVLFFRPAEGEELQLIAVDLDEFIRIDGLAHEDKRYIATLWMSNRRRSEIVAPFVYAKYSMLFPIGEFYTPNAVIPDADRIRAERLLYEKARTTFDTGYFSQSEIVFPVPIDDYPSGGGTQIYEGIETIMPPWLIITVFAFGPLLAAWTMTAATVRPNPNPA